MAKTYTPAGFAAAIIAGIEATYAPENTGAEMAKLSELFTEMAMSLTMHNEADPRPDARKVRQADILDAIAVALDR